ncbi:ABC transporter substrate-binding protein [Georgfuchsia toluolica]|uniref:ABC transporter substrate-binding protein n=1 Tax=Georgfuchsia toluolica TaxID=424218 RepID=A0A916J1S7_9PROT|nr:ABC transporter substrate-binding protein [Georgfuchsia toluolica]CAG4883099.1 ABC transporter substrate-binding protein [Georgfuchsia toluolica]
MRPHRFLFLLLLFTCAGTGAADLSIGLAADVSSLDPHYLNVASNNAVASHFFDTLVEVDADGHLIPGLAESWRTINPTTWEFKLRRGVKFSDGSDLTLDDVLFSLDRPAAIVNSPGPFTSFTKPIKSKRVIDADTLQIVTAQPYGPLPLNLASVFIVSRRAAASATSEDFNSGKAIVGSGPYRFVAFRRGESIEMARNEHYWGTKPAWDKVTFRIQTNDATRLASLLAGQTDAIEAVPVADLQRLKHDARFRIEQRVSWRTLFLQLDQGRGVTPDISDSHGKPLTRNPLQDKRVRLAMAKAINRNALVEHTLEGLGIPAADLVAPGIFGHADALQPTAYDPEGAKRLLAEAGYAGGFDLVLHGPNNRYINDGQVLQTIAQFYSRIGIRSRVVTLPLAVYFGKLRAGAYSVGLLGWGSLASDLALRNIVCTPDTNTGAGTWNWSGYSNRDVDATINQALAETDQGKRAKLDVEAATRAINDVAIIPLHHQIVSWAMKKGLRYTPRVDEFTFAQQFRKE